MGGSFDTSLESREFHRSEISSKFHQNFIAYIFEYFCFLKKISASLGFRVPCASFGQNDRPSSKQPGEWPTASVHNILAFGCLGCIVMQGQVPGNMLFQQP